MKLTLKLFLLCFLVAFSGCGFGLRKPIPTSASISSSKANSPLPTPTPTPTPAPVIEDENGEGGGNGNEAPGEGSGGNGGGPNGEGGGGGGGSGNANGTYHVYVANSGSNSISVFSLSALPPAALALHSLQTFTSTDLISPEKLAVGAGGKCLAATSSGTGKLSTFVRETNGTLTFSDSKILAFAATDLAFDHQGKYLYTISNMSTSVAWFEVSATCGLLPISIRTMPTLPMRIAADPSAPFLWITTQDSKLHLLVLSALDGAPTTVDMASAVNPFAMAAHPTDHRVFVSGDLNKYNAFSISSANLLPAFAEPQHFVNEAYGLQVDPLGDYLFSAESLSGLIEAWRISPDSSLNRDSAMYSQGMNTRTLAVTSNGNALVAVNKESGNISLLQINRSDRLALSFVEKTNVGAQPDGIVLVGY